MMIERDTERKANSNYLGRVKVGRRERERKRAEREVCDFIYVYRPQGREREREGREKRAGETGEGQI
jgi:hypothetical protein